MSETNFRHVYVLETIQREGWALDVTRGDITQFREVLRGGKRLWQTILAIAAIAYLVLLVYMLRPISQVERVTITQEAFEAVAKEARDNDLEMTANYYCTVIQGQLVDGTYYELMTVDTARLARLYPLDGLTRSRIDCVNIAVAEQMQFREQALGRINIGMIILTAGLVGLSGLMLLYQNQSRRTIQLYYDGKQPVIEGLGNPIRPSSHHELTEKLKLSNTSIRLGVMVTFIVAYLIIGVLVGQLIISIVTA